MADDKQNKQREDKDVDLDVSGPQTTINPETRTTGQGTNKDTRPGAEAETPGGNSKVPGNPNQGTPAR